MNPTLTTTTTTRRTIPTGPAIYAAGATITAIAAFLPWQVVRAVFIGQMSVTGMEGDGKITLFAGIMVALLAVWRWRKPASADRAAAILAGLFGVGIMFTGAYDTTQVLDTNVDGALFSAGPGLWLTTLAGLVIVIGAAADLIHTVNTNR
jgi:hypothetical protein